MGVMRPVNSSGTGQTGQPVQGAALVGIAHFIIGVIVPVVALMAQGELNKGWSTDGIVGATGAGALGALGAVFIIYAFRAGGLPAYVMPLVFGGAPVVNVLFTMYCIRRR